MHFANLQKLVTMEPNEMPGYSGSNATLHIVGIGASAGGPYALNCFLNALPEFGFVLVLLQHLSPKHRSHLSDLLAKGRFHLNVLKLNIQLTFSL